MEDKTIRPGFENAGRKKEELPRRNWSHRELLDRLDSYARLAKKGRDLKAMTDIKRDYLADNSEKASYRGRRYGHFRMGKKAGLHQGTTAHDLRRRDNGRDQADRNDYAGVAKDYYHRNYSLTRAHSEAAGPKKRKHRDRPRERE